MRATSRRDARRLGRLHRHQPTLLGQRDYGVAGQYGREPSPPPTSRPCVQCSTRRRVLAEDGTCWLNLGDSYTEGSATLSGLHSYGRHRAGRAAHPRMAAKNLLGLPWRVALALQSDG